MTDLKIGPPYGPQTANTVLKGPASGAPAIPTFAALVEADLGTVTGTTGKFLRGDMTWSYTIANPASFSGGTNFSTPHFLVQATPGATGDVARLTLAAAGAYVDVDALCEDGVTAFSSLLIRTRGADGMGIRLTINSSGNLLLSGNNTVFVGGSSAVAGTDTNVAGGNTTIRTGLPTGNAAATSITLQTSVPGASGTAAQTYADSLVLTNTMATFGGVVTVASQTATPAGGSTSARQLFGTTAGFGVYYGSGAPTVTAAQGSFYLRSDGGATTRAYINTDGGTTWTALVSVG